VQVDHLACCLDPWQTDLARRKLSQKSITFFLTKMVKLLYASSDPLSLHRIRRVVKLLAHSPPRIVRKQTELCSRLP
jgi:hypothetical protein